ncbi:hypothetical protein CBG25_15685 [Arsenophonus sp. ENCA]|uniref:hypothetical protein n=1 Tax=Arsenophonus sp. ENCA TaxID=1987579 RepID=UPI000BC593F3|nr:hypothetical protein [Arsenophonus sp. ENCA]PAV01610.1 hypothetical protein CBG25_15685 [Arsenophonus sp. ENCA]
MINKERLLRDNRLCKAIIGLSVEELKNLAAEFSACYLIYRKKNRKDHERQMGAGQKGFIPTPLDKLLFILGHLEKPKPTRVSQSLKKKYKFKNKKKSGCSYFVRLSMH